MPRTEGRTGSKWFRCDQCGFHYPVKYRARQRGFSFCTYIPCLDEASRQEDDDPRRLVFSDTPEDLENG